MFKTVENSAGSTDLPKQEEKSKVGRSEAIMEMRKDVQHNILNGALAGAAESKQQDSSSTAKSQPEASSGQPQTLAGFLKRGIEVRNIVRVEAQKTQVKDLTFVRKAIASLGELKDSKDANVVEYKPREVAKPQNLPASKGEDIVIIWEIAPLKAELTRKRMSKKLNFLKKQLAVANSILKHYIKVRAGTKKQVTIEKGTKCECSFEENVTYNAHLVIVTSLIDDTSTTIAQAGGCERDPTTNHAVLGLMEINLQQLVDDEASEYRKLNYLLTFVHEALHIISFHEDFLVFTNQNLPILQPNLKILANSKDPVWLSTNHWAEEFVPNDLMTEYSRPSRVLSIFTLETIEESSKAYIVDKKFLANNFFLEQIKDYQSFVKYKCEEEDAEPEYPFFCTHKMMLEDTRHCSADYVWRSYCDKEPLKNGCYNRVSMNSGLCVDSNMSKAQEWEEYGTSSRCFYDKKYKDSYCLKFELENDAVAFWVEDNKYICSKSGEIVIAKYFEPDSNKTKSIKFEIVCPDLDVFRRSVQKTSCPNYCSGHGFCSDGNCVCFGGYAGKDCSTSQNVVDETMVFTENKIQKKRVF